MSFISSAVFPSLHVRETAADGDRIAESCSCLGSLDRNGCASLHEQLCLLKSQMVSSSLPQCVIPAAVSVSASCYCWPHRLHYGPNDVGRIGQSPITRNPSLCVGSPLFAALTRTGSPWQGRTPRHQSGHIQGCLSKGSEQSPCAANQQLGLIKSATPNQDCHVLAMTWCVQLYPVAGPLLANCLLYKVTKLMQCDGKWQG